MGSDNGCDTSLPCVGECKDDNTLLTQIAFTILLVYSFYLLWRNIRNLLHLRDQRKKIRVHKLLIINLVIFVFLISNIILYADGFVSLFTKNGFLNFEAFNIVEEFTPCSQQIAFAIGYYNWSALFATVYDKPKQTVRRIAMGISALFILIFVLFYAFFCIYFSAVGIKHDGQADFSASPGFQAILEGFSAAILLNTSLFVLACGMLIKKLKTIYYFSSDKSARKMRNLLICTIFALILRVIIDVGLSFLTPFADLKCRISVQGDNAHTGDRIAWAIYMLGFFMICNLFPVTFLIINFSPVMTKNTTSSQSQDSEFNPSSGKKILLRGDGSSDLIR